MHDRNKKKKLGEGQQELSKLRGKEMFGQVPDLTIGRSGQPRVLRGVSVCVSVLRLRCRAWMGTEGRPRIFKKKDRTGHELDLSSSVLLTFSARTSAHQTLSSPLKQNVTMPSSVEAGRMAPWAASESCPSDDANLQLRDRGAPKKQDCASVSSAASFRGLQFRFGILILPAVQVGSVPCRSRSSSP